MVRFVVEQPAPKKQKTIMENIIININNSNYDQMSHLKTTSIKMSTFEKLMNSKEFVKEIQLGIKKRGNANYLIALVNKTKSLTKYMIETTDYIKENFLIFRLKLMAIFK